MAQAHTAVKRWRLKEAIEDDTAGGPADPQPEAEAEAEANAEAWLAPLVGTYVAALRKVRYHSAMQCGGRDADR